MREFEINQIKNPRVGVAQLSGKDDLAMLTAVTVFVHLGDQEVVNIATIREILDLCPNLQTVQVPPSLRRIVGPGIEKMLNDRGIELGYARMREGVYYNESFSNNEPNFRAKKESFIKAFRDPSKSQEISLMIRYELEDYEIARRYFGDKRVSISRIADEMGLSHNRVQRKISAFCHWAGYPSKWYEAVRRANKFARELTVLKNAEENVVQKQRLRESFAVGDILPPESLRISRWQMWQKVYQFYSDKPRLIEALHLNHPHLYTALVSYFQLFGYQPQTLRELAGMSGVSREAIRQRKNRALDYLGLVED